MMRKNRLFIGSVSDLFRRDDEDMSDSDDSYLIKAAESFEEKQYLYDKNDDYLLIAAEKYEKEIKILQIESKNEIQKKKLHAMIRLRDKKLTESNREFITEFFYHPLNWPVYILEILLSKDFVYTDRMRLALFFVGNGMVDPYVAERIFQLYNPFYKKTKQWEKRLKEFTDLFKYFDKPVNDPNRADIMNRYYYHNMITNRSLYLNGKPKENTK